MKYKINGNNNYFSNDIINEILINRNIDEDIFSYSKKDIPSPYIFTNMQKTVDCIVKHIENNSKIAIIEDSDPDGLTSTSVMYNYLKRQNSKLDISIIIHEKRVHGIFMDELNDLDIDLLIVPDAGSENQKEVKKIMSRNIDVVIIDHHPVKLQDMSKTPYFINNALDNKYTCLSGVGMVYLVCKALDDEFWTNYADDYMDLVMLGCISDMMHINCKYMQFIIQNGFLNIKNKMLKSLIDIQSYSIGDELNPIGISFYITPLINSVYRLGSIELKRNLTNAFCNNNDTSKYIYIPKRGKNKGVEIEESIYQKLARECKSLNEKRKTMGEKAIKEAKICEGCILNFIEIDKKYGENGIARIVANNFSRDTMLPTIVYYKNNKNKLIGSMSSGGYINKFKTKLKQTNIFNHIGGHEDASGFEINKEQLKNVKNILNKHFKDCVFEKMEMIDFLIPYNDFKSMGDAMAKEIVSIQNFYGRGFENPYILIENIIVPTNDIKILGKKKNTIKIKLNDKISAIKFNIKEEDYIDIFWEDTCKMNLIVQFDKNEYFNKITYQAMIKDIEIIGTTKETSEDDLDDWSW